MYVESNILSCAVSSSGRQLSPRGVSFGYEFGDWVDIENVDVVFFHQKTVLSRSPAPVQRSVKSNALSDDSEEDSDDDIIVTPKIGRLF